MRIYDIEYEDINRIRIISSFCRQRKSLLDLECAGSTALYPAGGLTQAVPREELEP